MLFIEPFNGVRLLASIARDYSNVPASGEIVVHQQSLPVSLSWPLSVSTEKH